MPAMPPERGFQDAFFSDSWLHLTWAADLLKAPSGWLSFSQSLSSVRASTTMLQSLFICLYPQCSSLGHCPKHMTIADGWKLDRLVNQELPLQAHPTFSTMVQYSVHVTADAACWSVTLSQPEGSNPAFTGRVRWPSTIIIQFKISEANHVPWRAKRLWVLIPTNHLGSRDKF